MLAPLGFVFYLSARINKMSVFFSSNYFLVICKYYGLIISICIYRIYTNFNSKSFFITAGTFGAMSLYGYTTKRDLTKLGGFFLWV